MWILPLYLHVNKKSGHDDDDHYETIEIHCTCKYI